jgi:hypothetical protein
MWHIALLNMTDKMIVVAEEYADKEEAITRIHVGLEPEAMQQTLGLGGRESGKEWSAWGPEEAPFSFDPPIVINN